MKFAVLDEADRMLDIGFRPDIERILRRCPEPADTAAQCHGATAGRAARGDAVCCVQSRSIFRLQEISVETIEQFYVTVDPERKFDLLERLLAREQPQQAIVFCRTKRGTDKVYQRLVKKKLEGVACIHGDLQQNARDRVMSDFRDGNVKILIATDVVGRGIDVSGISHIINYDIPQFCDDYVHRVGRTGRMGRDGVAYTFVSPEEGTELTRIEMRIDRLLTRDEMPGFQAFARPVASAAALAESADGRPVDGELAENGLDESARGAFPGRNRACARHCWAAAVARPAPQPAGDALSRLRHIEPTAAPLAATRKRAARNGKSRDALRYRVAANGHSFRSRSFESRSLAAGEFFFQKFHRGVPRVGSGIVIDFHRLRERFAAFFEARSLLYCRRRSRRSRREFLAGMRFSGIWAAPALRREPSASTSGESK